MQKPDGREGETGLRISAVPLVVFAGAHLGYDSSKVPIGGGAAVGQALIRCWAETKPFDLLVLGTGPEEPAAGVPYHRLPVAHGLLTDFSVRAYAHLARSFEQEVVQFLAGLQKKTDPKEVVVLHNDIAEAGDFQKIAGMGYVQAAIFHVDVVDYTAQIYLRGWVGAPTLAWAWRGLGRLGFSSLSPAVLRLIFEKQERCARFCTFLVVPSSGMAQVLRASYPWLSAERVAVVPWGALTEPPRTEEALTELKKRYEPAGRPVLLTLSRISPEKGQDLLLRALHLWERRGGERLLVLICGAPAFMHGKAFFRKLQRLAAKLKTVEVRFPGHVSGAEKQAIFRLSDLYIFPSRHESYGLTLMEAMAAGLPVLTTAHRSAQDLVRPEFGCVVPATPEGLYQGLRKLLAQGEKLRAMGEKARKFAEERPFSTAADHLGRLLSSLTEAKDHSKSPFSAMTRA